MNNSSGWVKLYRSIFDWEWWDDTNTTKVFIYCLLKANPSDKQWRGISVRRGSFVTSRKHIADEVNLTEQEVRTAIDHLLTTGILSIDTSNKGAIITIIDFEKYIDDNSNEDDCSFDYNENNYAPVRKRAYRRDDDLYLIRDSGTNYLKIGRSYNPYKRIKQLQTGHAGTLTMLYTLRGKGHLEKKFHKKFQNLNTSGEWFIDDGSIISEYRRFLKNE